MKVARTLVTLVVGGSTCYMLKSNLKGDVIMEFVVKNGNVKVGEIISLYMP